MDLYPSEEVNSTLAQAPDAEMHLKQTTERKGYEGEIYLTEKTYKNTERFVLKIQFLLSLDGSSMPKA